MTDTRAPSALERAGTLTDAEKIRLFDGLMAFLPANIVRSDNGEVYEVLADGTWSDSEWLARVSRYSLQALMKVKVCPRAILDFGKEPGQ